MPRLLPIVALLCASPLAAGERFAPLFKDIEAVARSKTTASPQARAAWDKLVAAGPAVLPQLLEAMNTPDTVVANWLRTAFDRIVESDRASGGKGIDVDALLVYVRDPKKQGRARRLALELVEQLRPGTTDKLIPGWLDDPEFRYESVAALIKEADRQNKEGAKDKALAGYRRAFEAAREVPQVQLLTLRLKEYGVAVSIAEHLGFLADWYLIGPFDAQDSKGFKTVYPPERQIDLKARLPGKSGMIEWKRYLAREATSGLPARVVLVNLPEALGNADDAVGYAWTVFRVDREQEVEFRGAADDNFQVWVNGKKEFGFEETRNGVRLDRHRFRVKLKAGENTVLVKICQAPHDPTNPEPNWEFLLRVVDDTGKGIPFTHALPEEKKPGTLERPPGRPP
jgi:hypothetical protein